MPEELAVTWPRAIGLLHRVMPSDAPAAKPPPDTFTLPPAATGLGLTCAVGAPAVEDVELAVPQSTVAGSVVVVVDDAGVVVVVVVDVGLVVVVVDVGLVVVVVDVGIVVVVDVGIVVDVVDVAVVDVVDVEVVVDVVGGVPVMVSGAVAEMNCPVP